MRKQSLGPFPCYVSLEPQVKWHESQWLYMHCMIHALPPSSLWHYIILYYVILYYIILYYIISYYIILIILYYIIWYDIILQNIILYYIIYFILLYYIFYFIILHYIILHIYILWKSCTLCLLMQGSPFRSVLSLMSLTHDAAAALVFLRTAMLAVLSHVYLKTHVHVNWWTKC